MLMRVLASLCCIGGLVACGPPDDDDDTGQTVPDVAALVNSGSPDRAIDIVFIAEDDYGDLAEEESRQAFLDDVGELIANGFWQNQGFAYNHALFNFWYLLDTGDLPVGAVKPCRTADWPDLSPAAFADIFILVHAEEMRDCRSGNRATTEPGSFRTVVHESGHAAFGLPDEYDGAGRYWFAPPLMYGSQEQCASDPGNSAWRDCVPLTSEDGDTWWRSEGPRDDIMRSAGDEVYEFGPGDWVIVRELLTALGAGPVSEPDTFAPDSWSDP
jgi:hypothetical protein